MNNIQWPIIIGLTLRSLTVIVIGLYILPLQLFEVRRPRNQFTGLRWLIFLLLVVSVFGSVPSLAYQYLRLTGTDSPNLRNVSTITANIGNVATTVFLVLVYNYRYKDEG